MYKNNAIFAQFFLLILAHFCHFICTQFSGRSNFSTQNAATVANKFQFHAHQGRSDGGGYIGIYTPKISPSKLFVG